MAEVGYQATLINAPQVDEEEQIEVTADEPAQQEKIAEPKAATEEPASAEPEPWANTNPNWWFSKYSLTD